MEPFNRKRNRWLDVSPEADRLIEAAKENRWGHRDATAILIAHRHGLRASELAALRPDIELHTGRLHVRRAINGTIRAPHIGQRKPGLAATVTGDPSIALFISERGAPLSVAGYRIGSPNEMLWKVGPG